VRTDPRQACWRTPSSPFQGEAKVSAMIDAIFAIKFVHVLAAGVMVGTWLCIALFMLLAHRSGNTAVVALTSQFVVRAELAFVAAAFALQPLSGFPLAWAIGLSPLNELWIVISLVFYAGLLACWLLALRIEIRIRDLTRQAALNAVPLPDVYWRLFRRWSLLALPILLGMITIYALMIWQPRYE
jgi:uncharacterized membrane protein